MSIKNLVIDGLEVDKTKRVGFVIELGEIGCFLINEISKYIGTLPYDKEENYGIVSLTNNEVVGMWSPWGAISEMEPFMLYALCPIIKY